MVVVGDFVGTDIADRNHARTRDRLQRLPFPSVEGLGAGGRGRRRPLREVQGHAGRDGFLEYLTTPEAAEIWAKRGGFSSPNKNVDVNVYPDEIHEADGRRRSASRGRSASTCPTCSRPHSAATPGQGSSRSSRTSSRTRTTSTGSRSRWRPRQRRPSRLDEPDEREPYRRRRLPRRGLRRRRQARPLAAVRRRRSLPRARASLLGVWIVYPTIRTIIRSFYDRTATSSSGSTTTRQLFTDDTLVTASRTTSSGSWSCRRS